MDGLPRVDELFAFLAVDLDGTEGIITLATPNGPLPCVAAKMAVADVMRPRAIRAATEYGRTVRLVRFSNREVLETHGGA